MEMTLQRFGIGNIRQLAGGAVLPVGILALVAMIGVFEEPAPCVLLLLALQFRSRVLLVTVLIYHRPVQAEFALPVSLEAAEVAHSHVADVAATIRGPAAHFTHHDKLRGGVHPALKALFELV